MQHANVLRCYDVHQRGRLQMPDFDKIGLKSEEVRMRECKCLWPTFPRDQPVWPCSPSVSIHEKGEFVVVKEELSIETFDRDRNYILAGDEIQGGVGMV